MATYTILNTFYIYYSGWGTRTFGGSSPSGAISGIGESYRAIVGFTITPGAGERVTNPTLNLGFLHSGSTKTKLGAYLYDDLTKAQSSYSTVPSGYLANAIESEAKSNTSSGRMAKLTWNIELTSSKTYYAWFYMEPHLSQGSYAPQIYTKSYSTTMQTPTLTGTASKITYTITYNANGGTGAPAAQTKEYGTNLTLQSTTPTRTGYTFKNWNTKSDGTGTSYSASGTYTNNASVILYAIWQINSYKIYLDPQDGSSSNSNYTGNYNTTRDITNLTRTGYVFGGWAWTAYGSMSNSRFSNSVFSGTSLGVSPYYYVNGGSTNVTFTHLLNQTDKPLFGDDIIQITCSNSTHTKIGGFAQTVTPEFNTTYIHAFYAKVPKELYLSIHHNTLPTGSVITQLTDFQGTGDWKVYAYKLVTGSSGNLGTFGHISAYASEADSSKTRTWWLGANQITKSPFDSKQTFTFGDGNTWAYGFWIPNRYSIKYNSNGGSGTMSNQIHTYDSPLSLTKSSFTKVGYKFAGWATSATGPVVYTDEQSVQNLTSTNEAVINLYAIWKPNGLIHIYVNNSFSPYLVYIYNATDKKWEQYIPYIYTNGEWTLFS